MARRRRTRAIAAGVLLSAVAITSFALYQHWRTHAHTLFGYLGLSDEYSRGKVGQTYYTDAVVQPRDSRSGHEVVNLRRVTPRVAENTAHATVTMLVCVRNGTPGIGSTLSTAGFCSSADAFKPGPVDLGFPTVQIIYAITPHTPGLVRLDGCDVDYGAGSRSGRQHVGAGVIVHVPTPAR